MDFDQRIRRDAKRVAGDREAAALLACLVEHLFDPGLDATFLGKVCGASREVRDRLAAVVRTLKGYVTELRMAEAARRARAEGTPDPARAAAAAAEGLESEGRVTLRARAARLRRRAVLG